MLTKEQINEIIPYLSASRIHSYMQCPNAFFLKYIEQLAHDETNDSYAKYGTLCHNIYENIANGKYASVDEPLQEYLLGYDDCGLTEKQREQYFQQGLESIKNKWEFLNAVDVVQAEAKFDTKPFEDVPKFYGFVDLVYRDEKGRLIVRDYKTSKKYTKPQLAKNIQAYFYAEACKELYGEYPYAFEFDFVRFGTTHLILIDQNYIKLNGLRVQGIWKQIENGIRKSNWNPFFCQNFCEGRSNCPLYQMKMGGKK